MKKHFKEDFIPLAIMAGILLVTALLTSFFTNTSLTGWMSILFSMFIYFFVPGYIILLFLELTNTERVILSFFAGGIISSLVFYFLNAAGLTLNSGIAYIIITAIISVLFVCYVIFKKNVSLKKE